MHESKRAKAKAHKRSTVVGNQNGIRVLSMCCFVFEEFDHNHLTLTALYYGKITSILYQYIAFNRDGDESCWEERIRLPIVGLIHMYPTYLALLIFDCLRPP